MIINIRLNKSRFLFVNRNIYILEIDRNNYKVLKPRLSAKTLDGNGSENALFLYFDSTKPVRLSLKEITFF